MLNMCFMIQFRPRPRVFWLWVTLATLISASTLMTMRHNSPDLITGFAVAVLAYYAGMWLGARITEKLGDGDAPITMPGRAWIVQRRQTRSEASQMTPAPRNRA